MRKVSAKSAQLIAREIEAEIRRLRAVDDTGQEHWPEDYDPNDIPFWEVTLRWFTAPGPEVIIENPHTKWILWTLALVNPIVQRKRNDLTENERSALEEAFYELAAEAPEQSNTHET